MRTRIKRLMASAVSVGLRNDEIRRAVNEGLVGRSGMLRLAHLGAMREVYSARRDTAASNAPSPLFISGRFRSGSTLIWQFFRAAPRCTAYYEPLNERGWFRAEAAGAVDPTHVGVSDYWAEYMGLEHLDTYFSEGWNDHRLYLTETDRVPGLFEYLDGLHQASEGRAVLQFNRADFRLPWLSTRFPDAQIMHVRRDPRDQWTSMLRADRSRVERDACLSSFQPFDHYYLTNWVRDLEVPFPCLTQAWSQHPYVAHYMLWELSNLFAAQYASHAVSYEALLAAPEPTIARMMEFARLEVPRKLPLIAEPGSKANAYADAAWFREQEAVALRLLDADYLAPVVSKRPAPNASGPRAVEPGKASARLQL